MGLDDLQIATPRLVLRVPRADDLDPWADMMADEDVTRFIGGVTPRPVTWRALMAMIGAWHATGFAMFSVIEQATGRWVGRLGPPPFHEARIDSWGQSRAEWRGRARG